MQARPPSLSSRPLEAFSAVQCDGLSVRLCWVVLALVTLAGCGGAGLPEARRTSPVRPLRPPRAERSASAPRTMPVVLSRNLWAKSAPITSRLDPMGQPWRITLHHEGTDSGEPSGFDSVAERLRTIAKVHERPTSRGGLGAGDLAYHFVIDQSGRIWEGRQLKYQGAHAGNGAANSGNIGIVLLGNCQRHRPTSRQLASLHRLIDDLCSRYQISRHNIYGHDEVRAQYRLSPTTCPGRFLSEWIEDFRQEQASARRTTW